MSAELLGETVERIFADQASPALGRPRPDARPGSPTVEDQTDLSPLWDTLAELRLPWVSVAEEAGGAGGDLDDAFTVLFHAGRHAVALPLAETGVLGGWLLSSAGLSVPEGPLAVPVSHELAIAEPEDPARGAAAEGAGLRLMPRGPGWVASGRLTRVPWGAQAAGVATLARSPGGPLAVLVMPEEVEVIRGNNLAGEPRDTFATDGVVLGPERVGPAPPHAAEWLLLRGALSRALLMTGAMDAVGPLSVSYANERAQFGRPIASFQAVAQRLAQLAEAAEAAGLATQVAARMFADAVGRGGADRPGPDVWLAVAAAKVTAGRSAREVSTHAHQVHGAVGMTEEYPLHRFTRRLWSWAHEWGGEAAWAQWLGDRVIGAGAPALWPALTIGLRA
jgi:acyl-CoA dehydrogenase